MDDFVISNLHESRNEWCSRLVSIFTPLVTEGIRSIFNESWKICMNNDEANKYLMTFQNLLSRVPKWNNSIIEEEKMRIVERSGCNYLEDLITCVHIIQLKALVEYYYHPYLYAASSMKIYSKRINVTIQKTLVLRQNLKKIEKELSNKSMAHHKKTKGNDSLNVLCRHIM